MAYATNRYGFRRITVAGLRCRWRLNMGICNSAITLQSADAQGGQQVYALLSGYPDPWLLVPSSAVRPLVVTPALVRQVVEQAFASGWQPELRAKPLRFAVSADRLSGA